MLKAFFARVANVFTCKQDKQLAPFKQAAKVMDKYTASHPPIVHKDHWINLLEKD